MGHQARPNLIHPRAPAASSAWEVRTALICHARACRGHPRIDVLMPRRRGWPGQSPAMTAMGYCAALFRGGSDARDGRTNIAPCRLARRELPPEVTDKLGDLVVAHVIPECGHIAEVVRCGLGDAVQDHLDEIVGGGTMQIAVQRQRRPAAEQRQAAE